MTPEEQVIEMESIAENIDLYCSMFNIQTKELFSILNISDYNDIQHWSYRLIVDSILTNRNHLKEFLNSPNNYKDNKEFKLQRLEALELEKLKLPIDIQNYFKNQDLTICPLCGDMLIHQQLSSSLLKSSACFNCGYIEKRE